MQVRRMVGGLVRACHPEPTVTVTALATAFAIAAGRGWGSVWVAAAVLAGQLSVGWSNDVIDHERDMRAGRPDKPIVAGTVTARAVGVAAAVALGLAVVLSLASGWRAASAHLAGVAAGWSYNLGVKATPLSPLPYAVGFAALPAFVVLGLPGHPAAPAWLLAAGALLGMGAHFANVLPDLDDDVRHGIVGLPHRIGARASAYTAGALLVAANVVLALGPADGPGVVGVAGLVLAAGILAAGLRAWRRPGSRLPFRVAMAVAALGAVLFIVRGNAAVG
jgi:4-hydroxybenzoate polyprenyltransferase